MTRFLLALPCTVLLIAGVHARPQERPPNTPAGTEGAQQDEQRAQPPAAAVAEERAQGHQPSSKQERRANETSFEDKLIAWSAVIQAFSAAVVAGFTILLTVYNKRLLRATETAANAAKSGADTAREALVLTESADVKVNDVTVVETEGTVFGHGVVSVRFQNFGRTRAVALACDFKVGIVGRDDLERSMESAGTVIDLGPGQDFSYKFKQFDVLFPAELVLSLYTGSALLKVWGEIRYRDVFGRFHTFAFEGAQLSRKSDFAIRKHAETIRNE